MVKQRSMKMPFDLRNNRMMVSLGPLSAKKYCTYSCPFCYVNADFLSYATMTVDDIVKWVKDHESQFDIIYVSGDTDSFAPPRTNKGLELLERLTEFGVDILFTTRYVFNQEELDELVNIRTVLAKSGKFLIGCVSVAQLAHPHLEPKPIAAPEFRLEQLTAFKKRGIVSVLAMRPFLPVVPSNEYEQIVKKSRGGVDVILGEVWYADMAGELESGVFQGPTPSNVKFITHKMDFDINDVNWKVYEAEETEKAVSLFCQSLNIPFFMRSTPAIEWIHRNLKP